MSLRPFRSGVPAWRAIAVAVGVAATAGVAADAPPRPADRYAIADGVALIPGGFAPGRQPDGNTVVFRGSRGLVVFDTGRHPEHSQAILDHAHSTGLPIVDVVNSHWHLDHVSGNPRLRKQYPALVVHATDAIDAALAGFLARSKAQAEQFLAQPGDPGQQAEVRADVATIDSGRAIAPDEVVRGDADVDWGGRSLHVGREERAVTAGDLWLYDPATRTLAAGDLVTLPVPFLDTACAARWSASLRRLEATGFERLVPGHGPVLDRDGLVRYRKAFDGFVACAASAAAAADCRAGWVRDAGSLLGDDAASARTTAMLDYYVDVLRDAPRQKEACGG